MKVIEHTKNHTKLHSTDLLTSICGGTTPVKTIAVIPKIASSTLHSVFIALPITMSKERVSNIACFKHYQ